MKKISILVSIIVSILIFQNNFYRIHAQEIGLLDVVFEKSTENILNQNFLMNEISYNIVKLHLGIAGKNIATGDYEGEILTTIKKLEELTKTDIIDLLSVSPDKPAALAKYLNESNQELQKGDTMAAYMKQEMEILKGDMQSCLTEKTISDKSYFDAINRYDQKIMNTSLTDSLKYETCVTENRIQYNAKIGIAQKLVFYLGVLQKKYDILFNKQEILAKNFEIFRDNILPDLNEIDLLLKQYKF